MAGLCKGVNEPSDSLKSNLLVVRQYSTLDKCFINVSLGAQGNWDFRISDLVKKPDLTFVVNFGEVRWAQLAKSALLTSSFVSLRSFQIF